MNHFAKKLSTELNKVFGLGCISTLLENVTKQVAVDVVILNPFSAKSWEIAISDRNEANT